MKNILDKNMFFAGLKAVILAKFGEQDAAAPWKTPRHYSMKLIRENKGAVKDARNVAYPMAGIYLALQEKGSKEEALKLMMDYAPSAGEAVKAKLAALTGIPGLPRIIWRNREAIMRSTGHVCH